MILNTRVNSWSGPHIRRYLDVILDRLSKTKTASERTFGHKAEFCNWDTINRNKKAPLNSDFGGDNTKIHVS
jgi:hypothetical protein